MLGRVALGKPTPRTDIACATPVLSSRSCRVYSNQPTQKQQTKAKEGGGGMVPDLLPVGGLPAIVPKQERVTV